MRYHHPFESLSLLYIYIYTFFIKFILIPTPPATPQPTPSSRPHRSTRTYGRKHITTTAERPIDRLLCCPLRRADLETGAYDVHAHEAEAGSVFVFLCREEGGGVDCGAVVWGCGCQELC
jgi:hypothetical protein